MCPLYIGILFWLTTELSDISNTPFVFFPGTIYTGSMIPVKQISQDGTTKGPYLITKILWQSWFITVFDHLHYQNKLYLSWQVWVAILTSSEPFTMEAIFLCLAPKYMGSGNWTMGFVNRCDVSFVKLNL